MANELEARMLQEEGTEFYPITHAKAVVTSNGLNLDEDQDRIVRDGICRSSLTLTASERASALTWLGFQRMPINEYEALLDKRGIYFVTLRDDD